MVPERTHLEIWRPPPADPDEDTRIPPGEQERVPLNSPEMQEIDPQFPDPEGGEGVNYQQHRRGTRDYYNTANYWEVGGHVPGYGMHVLIITSHDQEDAVMEVLESSRCGGVVIDCEGDRRRDRPHFHQCEEAPEGV